MILWIQDGACSSREIKYPCGHSWVSNSITPLQVENRSSLVAELSRQPLIVRGGCHPRPGCESVWKAVFVVEP